MRPPHFTMHRGITLKLLIWWEKCVAHLMYNLVLINPPCTLSFNHELKQCGAWSKWCIWNIVSFPSCFKWWWFFLAEVFWASCRVETASFLAIISNGTIFSSPLLINHLVSRLSLLHTSILVAAPTRTNPNIQTGGRGGQSWTELLEDRAVQTTC